MDFLNILETFGLPVFMVFALGFYIQKQNKFIQDELQTELRESFTRVEGIIVKLIDQSKINQLEQKDIKASYRAIVDILASLSGNGLKDKFLNNKRDF